MDQIPNILPHASDLRVEAYFITELFNSWKHYPIADPEGLTAKALEHFDHIDDSDLKCELFQQY
jgi:hypothetical protein